MRIDLRVEIVGDESVANAHLQMRADRTARENRRVLRFDRPDFDGRVLGLQHFADARKRPPRADARTEAVNRTRGLLHDFQRRMVTVRGGIRRIGELLGNENLRIFLRHALRHRGALGNRIADVARIMNETDLRAVMLDQLPTLFTDAVGHDDDRLIAAHGADERKANALIAARRFDDDGIGLEASAGLGIENHVVGRPRLD